MKDFTEHFNLLLNKLKIDENFAYLRYSDGEMHILMDRDVRVDDTWYELNGVRASGKYDKTNYKDVNQIKHKYFVDALKDSYKYHANNYFVGLSCRCCVGDKDFQWMVDFRGGDDEHLTWANLLINGNYNRFISEMLPLFKNKKIVFIGNEIMDTSKLPFEVVKDFRVGQNCMITNYDLSDEINEWVNENDIKNHVFLFSASSLSEVLIHKLFINEVENTYIDIGTMFNTYLGFDANRSYLQGGATLTKKCIW
tara:strand:+ start:1901 stop:2659 length:759 start_codon:yes stop_codon:yes gene_type:complete